MVARPRVLRRLDDILSFRLTAVVAGPGTGKTTALAHWSEGHRTIWHTAAPGDSDSALMGDLLEGLRAHVPTPRGELCMALDRSRSPDVGTDPIRFDALAGAFGHHVATAWGHSDEHLVVIIDELHVLEPGGSAAELVAALVRHTPPQLHVVLSSRTGLPFPTARLRDDGLCTEVFADELAFTAEEVRTLLCNPAPDAEDHVADLLTETGGWAIATACAARTGRRPGSDRAPRSLPTLAAEVLLSEPPPSAAALLDAAHLPWITPELVDDLELDGASRLADVAIVPAPQVPGAVTVTPFLRDHLLGTASSDCVSVRHRAAHWYEARGWLPEALWCLADAAEPTELAEFFARAGAALLRTGYAADVAAALDTLSAEAPEVVDDSLRRLFAEAHLALGDTETALAQFQSLIPANGPIPAQLARTLGSLHYVRGTTNQGLDVLDRADVDAGPDPDVAAVLAWAAAVRWSRGEREQARTLGAAALQRAESAGDSTALALTYTVLTMIARVDGDSVAHHSYYAQSLANAERARDLFQIVRIRCNEGSHLMEDGEYVKALDELDIASRLAALGGYGFLRGLCLNNRAEALVAVGRLDEAVSDLDAARAIFQRLAPPMDAHPLGLLGEVYLARGDQALALAAFEKAAAIASHPVEIQALVPALAGVATVRADDDPVAALETARQAADLEATVHHVKALIALGRTSLANGDEASAIELAERAISLARTRGDRPGLAQSLELIAALGADPTRRLAALEDARTLWSELGTPFGMARVDISIAEMKSGSDAVALAEAAARTLDRLGAKRGASRARAVAAARLAESASDVTVHVLGGFSLLLGGIAVQTTAWQSKVARDLFKMLVINRGRPIHREVLMDRLWPGEVDEKARNRLSVALSAIRSTTDPERAHPSDHVVIADRDSVALNRANVSVDVVQFLAEATRGQSLRDQGHVEQGLALLRIAENRYAGDVLEESPYADWAVPLREEALTTYLAVAGVLADADAAAGDHESAARRYLRMIERDPFSECAYLGAIASLRAAGHHGSAQRLYGSYVTKMTELDVEPAMFPAA